MEITDVCTTHINWSLVDKATAEGDDDDDVPPPDAYEIEEKFEMVSTFPLPSTLSLSE